MKGLVLVAGLVLLLALLAVQTYFVHRQRRRLAQIDSGDPDSVYLFSTPSCGVCMQMKRAYGEWIDKGAITSVDITKELEMAKRYGITAVPTTVVVRRGKVTKAFLGFVKAAELLPWLQCENGGQS